MITKEYIALVLKYDFLKMFDLDIPLKVIIDSIDDNFVDDLNKFIDDSRREKKKFNRK